MRTHPLLAQALPETQQQHRQEQPAHEVAQPLDLKPHGLKFVAQFPWGIAAAMMQGFVVRTPEKPIRRYGDDHRSPRLADPVEFSQGGQVIVHVFEHVKRRHHIKGIVGKTQFLDAAPRQMGKPPLP
ncbi:hypothetical protein Cabther_A1161 [Chloracidobacterium thermophilum B]|uniref:Uncharacterized protein n=1 Tax=Chloracidobacterium thermophilum (strain B) TaxID=981222 RepID=G2LIL7_CHLTF|nr:hypothetical protein Cabther_A1161 [Chloracidobacterium thermophilum B]